MKLHIFNQDVLDVVAQLPLKGALGFSPKFQGVKFEAGGTIWLDGALGAPVGGLDVKVKLQLILVNPITIRLRIIDILTSGQSTRTLVMFFIRNVLAGLDAPFLTHVQTKDDEYFEFKNPVDFWPLQSISTDDNCLTIEASAPIVTKLQSYIAAMQKQALDKNGSMAAQAVLASRT
jgi:hypothetical protein